jgi:hypothetical protein
MAMTLTVHRRRAMVRMRTQFGSEHPNKRWSSVRRVHTSCRTRDDRVHTSCRTRDDPVIGRNFAKK